MSHVHAGTSGPRPRPNMPGSNMGWGELQGVWFSMGFQLSIGFYFLIFFSWRKDSCWLLFVYSKIIAIGVFLFVSIYFERRVKLSSECGESAYLKVSFKYLGPSMCACCFGFSAGSRTSGLQATAEWLLTIAFHLVILFYFWCCVMVNSLKHADAQQRHNLSVRKLLLISSVIFTVA